MKIGFIGAGRVATHLATKLFTNYQIVQIFSRHLTHATRLAEYINAQPIDDLNQIDPEIELLIISVNDQAISTVVEQLKQLNFKGLVVHTSGSTHIDVLAKSFSRTGVFYPLQTFSFESKINWQQTPLFIEAHDVKDREILYQLATFLSQKVYEYTSEQRLSLHLAAVFACNFSNYCYAISKQILDQSQVDFSLLHPLMLETARKATFTDPQDVQTGPASRGDLNIIQMHQEMLKTQNETNFLAVYQLLSAQIMKKYEKN